MGVRSLLVKILGDDRDVRRAFERSSASARTFGKDVTGVTATVDRSFTRIQKLAAGGFVGGVAAGAALNQINAAVNVASNLNEQMARSNVVFGSAADAVVAWSETTAEAMGIAQDEALAAAGTFGAMFAQAGQGATQAARLSQQMVTLASDLASFNNTGIEETLVAIRSGLSGEIEPLRRFQVFLTEAAVSQRAMADTGKDNVAQLTQGEKILARYNLILEQTGRQQGDYARTSESLANTQRRLSAQVRDLQADIGGALLPAVANMANVLSDAVAVTSELRGALRGLGQVEIPTLEIPFAFKRIEIGGGDIGGFAGDVARRALEGALPPQAREAFRFLRLLIPEAPQNVDTSAAERWDEVFAPFTDAAVGEGKKAVTRAQKKVSNAFGQPGFTPLESNDLGERLQRQFDTLLESLDLRVDQASAAGDTDRALAVLAQTETAIQKRIRTEGRTTGLLRQLFEVQQERRGIVADLARERDRARQDRVNDVLEGLGLAVDRAQLTDRLDDDLRSLNDLASGLRTQIRKGGDVLRFQQELQSVTGQIADVREQIQQRAADAAQARQFRILGLTETGDEVIPGVPNLRRQLSQLTSRLVDEGEMTPKIRAQLQKIGRVLALPIDEVKDQTREKVRDMFRGIREVFDEETNKGIAERRRVTLSDKILAALGFGRDPDTVRLNQLGTAGLSSGAVARAAIPTSTTGAAVTITGPITVVADNPDAFLRELQKKAGRTTATSRGRFPGKSLGLG